MPRDPWQPGTVFATERGAGARGLLDRRGLIHAHSIYSWDACDEQPRDADGKINMACLADFRRGLCASRHDFAMLTDHKAFFSETDLSVDVLYDPSRGDQLLDRGQGPVANWMSCGQDEDSPLILAGCEAGVMPVGLERHVAASQAEREAIYGSKDVAAIQKLKDAGAVALVQHTEKWTAEELAALPIDGFEMYNLHANAILGAGAAMGLIADLKAPEELPHPDLVFLPIISEDTRYVETWGTVLAGGAERVTTMGTDCHQNLFENLLPDGERIDSYRRTMGWFSNHLLVVPSAAGGFDDLGLKQALRSGRLYGAFEVLGFPVGFDFHAESSGQVSEMGSEVSLSAGVTLVAKQPRVRDLDPSAPKPEIVTKLLRAKPAGWDEIAVNEGDIEQPVETAGAYRVEVRIEPRHLAAYLSSYGDLAGKSFVWIYSNAIYVR